MCIEDIKNSLIKIAFQKTIPFCYQCYKEAPTGVCNLCHSDDLMRLLPGSGCEYGTDWVIKELIQENLTEVDCEENFEQMIDDCYGETINVGFMDLVTTTVMKDQDPICWDIAKGEHMDSLLEDEQVLTFDNGSNYYWTHDVESLIDELIEEKVS